MFIYRLVAVTLLCLTGCSIIKQNNFRVEKLLNDTTCNVTDSPNNPYIVNWSASHISSLKSASSKGAIIVSYDECRNIKILNECTFSGTYNSKSVGSPLLDTQRFVSEFSLKSALPLFNANLFGRINSNVGLEMKTLITGSSEFVKTGRQFSLNGGESCIGASHYISQMDIGASVLQKFSINNNEAGANVLLLNASSENSSSSNILLKRGDIEACKQEGYENKNCRIPLKIRLSPLKRLFPTVRNYRFSQRRKRINDLERETSKHIREVNAKYNRILPLLRKGNEDSRLALLHFENLYSTHRLGNPRLEDAKREYESAVRRNILREEERQNQIKESIARRASRESRVLSKVTEQIERRLHRINNCAKAESARNPELQSITLHITLNKSGSIRNVRPLEDTTHASIQCFYRSLRSIRIGRLNANKFEFYYPINLRSRSNTNSVRNRQEKQNITYNFSYEIPDSLFSRTNRLK